VAVKAVIRDCSPDGHRYRRYLLHYLFLESWQFVSRGAIIRTIWDHCFHCYHCRNRPGSTASATEPPTLARALNSTTGRAVPPNSSQPASELRWSTTTERSSAEGMGAISNGTALPDVGWRPSHADRFGTACIDCIYSARVLNRPRHKITGSARRQYNYRQHIFSRGYNTD
jgi:hypothetical protein